MKILETLPSHWTSTSVSLWVTIHFLCTFSRLESLLSVFFCLFYTLLIRDRQCQRAPVIINNKTQCVWIARQPRISRAIENQQIHQGEDKNQSPMSNKSPQTNKPGKKMGWDTVEVIMFIVVSAIENSQTFVCCFFFFPALDFSLTMDDNL